MKTIRRCDVWERSGSDVRTQEAVTGPRNAEYYTLGNVDKARVDAVVEDAKRKGQRTNTTYGTRDYYAYPHPAGGHAWGIDDPGNIKRGVK